MRLYEDPFVYAGAGPERLHWHRPCNMQRPTPPASKGSLLHMTECCMKNKDADACRKPTDSVNFVIAHDGFTLYDLVSYNEKHNDQNGEGNRSGSSMKMLCMMRRVCLSTVCAFILLRPAIILKRSIVQSREVSELAWRISPADPAHMADTGLHRVQFKLSWRSAGTAQTTTSHGTAVWRVRQTMRR